MLNFRTVDIISTERGSGYRRDQLDIYNAKSENKPGQCFDDRQFLILFTSPPKTYFIPPICTSDWNEVGPKDFTEIYFGSIKLLGMKMSRFLVQSPYDVLARFKVFFYRKDFI